uniref:hypothetical protein n=1 Tax=Corynebacterium sp. TaxID=1720 RepID=UPI0037351013
MSGLQRISVQWAAAVLAALIVLLLGAWPALAQETAETDSPGALGQAQQQCMDVSDSRSVLDQLVADGAISKQERDEAAGLFGFDEDKVAAIQADNAERWDEIVTHHEEERGWAGKAARGAQNLVCWAGSPVNAGIDAVNNSPFWEDPIGKFAKSVMEGNNEALTTAMMLWMDFSTTSVDVNANTQGVKNIVMGVCGFALAASFIVGGWRIASARRGGLQEGLTDLNENMIRWLVFSIAVPVMFPGAMVASDAIADAIMQEFGGADQLINLGGIEESQFGPVVTLVLAGITLIGSFVQILALVTRVLLAPIAAGLSPLFAALSFSDTGRQGLNHLVAFLIAAIAFKPVSALLYAVVLWNVSGTGDIGATGVIINALMIGIAGFSAPALVRALVPAVSQAGGGGAAPMLAGATGAIAGMAGMAGALANRGGAALSKLGNAGSSTGSGAQNIAGSAGGGPGGGSSAAGSGAPGPAGPRGGGGASRMSAAAQAGSQPSGAGSGASAGRAA